jgi:hypothetical protein
MVAAIRDRNAKQYEAVVVRMMAVMLHFISPELTDKVHGHDTHKDEPSRSHNYTKTG